MSNTMKPTVQHRELLFYVFVSFVHDTQLVCRFYELVHYPISVSLAIYPTIYVIHFVDK